MPLREGQRLARKAGVTAGAADAKAAVSAAVRKRKRACLSFDVRRTAAGSAAGFAKAGVTAVAADAKAAAPAVFRSSSSLSSSSSSSTSSLSSSSSCEEAAKKRLRSARAVTGVNASAVARQLKPVAALHLKSCWRAGCPRCQFFRNEVGWKAQLPMVNEAHRAEVGKIVTADAGWLTKSWLHAKGDPDSHDWGVGCRVCHAQLAGKPVKPRRRAVPSLATYTVRTRNGVKFAAFLQHQALFSHRAAVLKFLGLKVGAEEDVSLLGGAPPKGHFAVAFDHFRKGNSARKGASVTTPAGKAEELGRWKLCRLGWCCAEAMKDMDRDYIKGAVTLALLRDEKAPRLHLRFTGCDEKLVTRAGWLGQAHVPKHAPAGSSGLVLTEATESIITAFATRRSGAPGGGSGRPCNNALKRRICNITEMIGADAAEDEMVSTRDMRRPLREDMAPLTPNVRAVVRDHTHGVRRLTRRGWGG